MSIRSILIAARPSREKRRNPESNVSIFLTPARMKPIASGMSSESKLALAAAVTLPGSLRHPCADKFAGADKLPAEPLNIH